MDKIFRPKQVWVKTGLHDRLVIRARSRGLKIQEAVEQAIEQWLEVTEPATGDEQALEVAQR